MRNRPRHHQTDPERGDNLEPPPPAYDQQRLPPYTNNDAGVNKQTHLQKEEIRHQGNESNQAAPIGVAS